MYVEAWYGACGPDEDQIGLVSACWYTVVDGILYRHNVRWAVYQYELTTMQLARMYDYPIGVVAALGRVLRMAAAQQGQVRRP